MGDIAKPEIGTICRLKFAHSFVVFVSKPSFV